MSLSETKDRAPQVNGVDSVVVDKNEIADRIETVYKTMGEKIGWYNQTSDPNKVADVEILMVSGYDTDLVVMHHRVRDLLEANVKWNGVLFKGFDAPKDIYDKIDGHLPMTVELLDEDGKGTKVFKDLREMAQLLRMEEHNGYLGTHRLKTEELRKKFLAGEDLTVSVGGEKGVVDLRAVCKFDDLKDFDFEDYLARIKENQIGFQWLGGTRDQALQKHHIENGSHTLFVDTGRIKANGNREYLWMPVSATLAAEDARVDLPKTTLPFRAEGHVHEVAQYCEDNGTTVGFDSRLLKMHRGEVSLRDHNKTNTRMNHAAVGLAAKEEMKIVSDQPIVCPDGETRNLNVAVIGAGRRGKIYEGMHKTYDQAMLKVRGQKLTDQEADDLIFTRVIAPFIINNAKDWLMCFAKSAAAGTGYSAEKAVITGGENWMDYGKKEGRRGFCVAVPCKDGDSETGLRYFFNYNELINYVNERIKAGDILDINNKTEIPTFSGMSQAEADREQELRLEDEEDEASTVDELDLDKMGSLASMLRNILGDNLENALKEFVANGSGADISIEGKRQKFLDFISEKLRLGNFSEVISITGLGDEAGKKKLLSLLRRMTPEMRNDVLEYVRNGKQPEKRLASSLSSEILKLIKDSGSRMADFMLAVDRCRPIVGSEPGFVEQTTVEKGKKNTDKKVDSKWGSLMTQVAKIVSLCRSNETVKSVIGEKVNDPRWLLREALIQLRRFDEIKELGL